MNLLAAIFCVFLFSLTAPFTRLAALSISPELIILLRILGAGIVCLIFVGRDRWVPPKQAWPAILATSLGSVVGFNSFMAYGLRETSAGHAAVALAGLPIVTSVYAILRDRLQPGLSFWFFALCGTLLSLSFFYIQNINEFVTGDLYLFLAVLAAAFGYVEGGRSSRRFGGARTMSWAVLLTLPVCVPLTIFHLQKSSGGLGHVTTDVWFSLIYLALISQSLGMFLWFKVLGKGPMEKLSLAQLLQPFFTLLAAIILLNEEVSASTWLIAALVAICVLGANKGRQ